MQFSGVCDFVVLVQKLGDFAVEMPSAVSTPHSKFQVNCARRFRDTNFKKISFLVFFFH